MMTEKKEPQLSVRAVSPSHDAGDTSVDIPAPAVDEKTEPPAPKPSMANFFKILAFGDALDWTCMGICTFSAVGAGIAMPLMFLVFGRVVGDFTGYFTPGQGVGMENGTIGNGTDVLVDEEVVRLMVQAAKDKFLATVNKNAMYMVYLGLARFMLSYISMLSIRISGLRISARLRLAYLRALFQQPISTIDATSPGAIASRLTTNSNTIESGISQQFSLAIQAISFTLGLYIVAFVRSALLTLVASASIPIVMLCYAAAVPFMYKFWTAAEKWKDAASGLAFEIFESVRIVVAFGAEGRLSEKHHDLVRRAAAEDRKNAPMAGVLMAPMFLAVYATFALTFWFGIRQFMGGKIEGISTIIIVLFSVLWAEMCVFRLYSPIVQIIRASTAASEILAVLNATVPPTTGLDASEVSLAEDIIFRDVTFAYPTRPDTIILDGLSVRFEAGKTTAVVGPSGSGKSTIVGLLEKWYVPARGAHPVAPMPATPQMAATISAWPIPDHEALPGIFVGGVNLALIDERWWRSCIGLVQQEPFLFDDTIAANVAYGLAGTQFEHAESRVRRAMVEAACREAYADEFIARLPRGYETRVGKGGMKLSGGQRQRLAIARAIVKDPPVLILDEATSAVDVRTEKIVQRALDRVSRSRTTICIAHRLSTIRKADKIVVIRAGRVVEEGTHEELLKNEDGVYSGFVRAQAVEMGDGDGDEGIDASGFEEFEMDDPKFQIRDDGVEEAPSGQQKHIEKGFLGSFGMLLYEQRSRWVLYLCTVLGASAGGATYPLQAYLFAKVIEVFTMAKSELVRRGNFWALMFAILAVGMGFAFLIMGWSSSLISTVVSSYYRQEYLENILRKRISFFDREENSSGTLTARLSTDSTQLQQLLGAEMGMALVAVLSIVGSVIIAFVFGWKLSLVGVLAVMPVVLIAGYFRVSLEADFEKLNALVFAESSQFGAEAIGGFRTVKSLIMEDTIADRFADLLKTHVDKALKKARVSTLVFAFSDSADMLCQALCFWYGGQLLASREYDIVSFFVIYMAVVQSSMAAGMWFSFSPNIVDATAAANRILSVRPRRSEQALNLRHMPLGMGPASIEFKDVSFAYEERATPVLSGINIRIEAGQFAAFVGASGSGKSTMISLLERFYDPSQGRIEFNGANITEVDPASYRRNLSLVAQESTLYEGTIRENVSLSVPSTTEAEIVAACTAAQIHPFIASLPDGYETHIGPKGVALSGGQRQRLALARALLRRPQVLLLDEATANLDSASEKLVAEAIEQAAGGGRTVIAVAHRLATVQGADVIFVFGSGRVLERGNHAELLARRGVYYQMCQAQALDR
ncbi:leptomycin B resistance protein pmd1 [Trichodelitschia bisporula]|uniref:Leptomycin B resistance protein pmd1 n=1 Tax=Trichodelitschia bisporula TaxID=703511 RepID=A0A6G1HTQ7_9PEZI|nr:leptomycin B resistance protein pmd1 [Trichodelitschia bisporula]